MLHRIRTAITSNPWRIAAGAVLLTLPALIMGWTVPLLGPSADDWLMIEKIGRGRIFPWNNTRPLHSTAWFLADVLMGNKLSSYMWMNYLLMGVAAILFVEILRRALRPWIGGRAELGALLGGLIFVLYPSDVSHQWASTGTDPIIHIVLFASVLLWMQAGQTDRPVYGVAAAGTLVINMLQKESTFAIYALLPLILLACRRSPIGRKWLPVVGLWYAAMAGYAFWRLVLLPRTDPTDMVELYTVNRHLAIQTVFPFTWISLKALAWDAFRLAFADDTAALARLGISWFTPAALGGAALLAIGGWAITRREADDAPLDTPPDIRLWALLAGIGLVAALAGLAPYYPVYEIPVQATGSSSRYTSAAVPGISFLLTVVALLPLAYLPGLLKRRAARIAGVAITLALAAVLAAGGMIRQYRADYQYIAAWDLQRTFWQRILDLNLSYRPDTAIFLHNFPLDLDGFPLGYAAFAYEPALKVIYQDLPPDIHVINSGPGHGWTVRDGMLVSRRNPKTERYPLDHVVILYLDDRNMITVSPRLPADWSDQPTLLYTGTIPPGPPTPLKSDAAAMFGPRIEPAECRTWMPVFSHDGSPGAGTILAAAYPTGELVDRRAVAAGAALDYRINAPCSAWIRLYFEPSGSPDGALSWLVSQYGAGADYGTADTPESVVYDTSFGAGTPADPAQANLH